MITLAVLEDFYAIQKKGTRRNRTTRENPHETLYSPVRTLHIATKHKIVNLQPSITALFKNRDYFENKRRRTSAADADDRFASKSSEWSRSSTQWELSDVLRVNKAPLSLKP